MQYIMEKEAEYIIQQIGRIEEKMMLIKYGIHHTIKYNGFSLYAKVRGAPVVSA